MPHDRHENAGFGFWGDPERTTSAPDSTRDYRVRAMRLRAIAADSSDPEIRAYLLTTAAQFDRLADYAAASGNDARRAIGFGAT